MAEDTNGSTVMGCPLCSENYGLHLDSVVLSNGGGSALADPTGRGISVSFELPDASYTGDRHDIAILGWCEACGKKFRITYRQHKGQTIVKTELEAGDVFDTAVEVADSEPVWMSWEDDKGTSPGPMKATS